MVIYSQFEASAPKLVSPPVPRFASREIEIQRKALPLRSGPIRDPATRTYISFDRRLTRRRYYFVERAARYVRGCSSTQYTYRHPYTCIITSVHTVILLHISWAHHASSPFSSLHILYCTARPVYRSCTCFCRTASIRNATKLTAGKSETFLFVPRVKLRYNSKTTFAQRTHTARPNSRTRKLPGAPQLLTDSPWSLNWYAEKIWCTQI